MHFKIKKISGHKYLYLIRNMRINGKMKQVKQICVGTADKVLALLMGKSDLIIKSYPFGTTAALLHAARRIGLVEAIDSAVGKKKMDGLTVGEYVLTLISARADTQLSRAKVEGWFKESLLQFLLRPVYKLSSQNCLNQMRHLDKETIRTIQDTLTGNLLRMGICPTKLVFDTTNRFCYIEHGESIPRKAHSKQKRFDKNVIGLALAVNDANLPFFSEVYPANKNDAKVFPEVFEEICRRVDALRIDAKDIILVIDKGNNSEGNIGKVIGKMHVVGALPKSVAGDILAIPEREFKDIYTNAKRHLIKGFATHGTFYGRQMKVVIQYNAHTRSRQFRQYTKSKARILQGIEDLRQRCLRPGKGRKPSEKGIINALGDLVQKKLRGVFEYGIETAANGRPCPWMRVNTATEAELIESMGKTAVFTDRLDMPDEALVRAYNSKWMIEDDFKWFNDKVVMPLWPFYVRKDIPIQAHVFICVLGLMLYRFLQQELAETKTSIPRLIEKLDRIRLAIAVEGNRKARFVVEKLDAETAKVFSTLDLARFVPR